MIKTISKIILFPGILLCVSCSPMSKSSREIADPNLPYITVIKDMRDGFNVVVYNPDSCLQIGAACGFFRAHAFAHERLNHSIIDVPSYYPPLFEQQADCWAAKYASTAEVVAAVQLLENPDSAARWRLNGDLEQRARIVRDCAIQAGNWTGTDQE